MFIAVANQAIARMEGLIKEGSGRTKYDDYISLLKRYHIEFFDRDAITDIDHARMLEFDTWRENKAGKNPSKSSIVSHNTALKRVFDEAVIRKLLVHSQVPELNNTGDMGERRAHFTRDEFEKVARSGLAWLGKAKTVKSNEIRELLLAYIYFAVGSGIRPGRKIESITWGDVFTKKKKGRSFTLVYVKKGKTTKYTGTREVVLKKEGQFALELLKGFKKKPNKTDKLFMSKDGNVNKEFTRNFAKLLDSVGLKDSPNGARTLYSLRHSYITWRIEEEVNIHVIAKQCGTSTQMIEQHYKLLHSKHYGDEIFLLMQ